MITVQCQYLGREAEALTTPPWPGDLGERIQRHISAEAWQLWLQHQTMLINEKRLSPRNPDHKVYLQGQMEAFLFGGEVDQAAGYTPPK